MFQIDRLKQALSPIIVLMLILIPIQKVYGYRNLGEIVVCNQDDERKSAKVVVAAYQDFGRRDEYWVSGWYRVDYGECVRTHIQLLDGATRWVGFYGESTSGIWGGGNNSRRFCIRHDSRGGRTSFSVEDFKTRLSYCTQRTRDIQSIYSFRDAPYVNTRNRNTKITLQ
jgi:hypothetical protein